MKFTTAISLLSASLCTAIDVGSSVDPSYQKPTSLTYSYTFKDCSSCAFCSGSSVADLFNKNTKNFCVEVSDDGDIASSKVRVLVEIEYDIPTHLNYLKINSDNDETKPSSIVLKRKTGDGSFTPIEMFEQTCTNCPSLLRSYGEYTSYLMKLYKEAGKAKIELKNVEFVEAITSANTMKLYHKISNTRLFAPSLVQLDPNMWSVDPDNRGYMAGIVDNPSRNNVIQFTYKFNAALASGKEALIRVTSYPGKKKTSYYPTTEGDMHPLVHAWDSGRKVTLGFADQDGTRYVGGKGYQIGNEHKIRIETIGDSCTYFIDGVKAATAPTKLAKRTQFPKAYVMISDTIYYTPDAEMKNLVWTDLKVE